MSEFRFGDAMSRWWQLSTRRYGTSLLISLAAFVPALLIIALVGGVVGYSLLSGSGLSGSAATSPEAIFRQLFSSGIGVTAIFLMSVLFIFLYSWLIGAHSALADGEARGNRIGFGTAMALGWRRMISVTGANFLIGMLSLIAALPGVLIGVILGSLLMRGSATPLALILAGIVAFVGICIVTTIYLVAAPAAAVEDSSATESMARSKDLTLGNRWAVFGVYLVVTVLTSLATNIPEAFIGAVNKSAGSAVGGLIGLLSLPFTFFLVPAIFCALREAKEGKPVAQVANVFS